jgi:hypothetical protein
LCFYFADIYSLANLDRNFASSEAHFAAAMSFVHIASYVLAAEWG